MAQSLDSQQREVEVRIGGHHSCRGPVLSDGGGSYRSGALDDMPVGDGVAVGRDEEAGAAAAVSLDAQQGWLQALHGACDAPVSRARAARLEQVDARLIADAERGLRGEGSVALPGVVEVLAVAERVSQQAQLDRCDRRLRVKLQHGGLEVLANAAVHRPRRVVQHGLAVVVAPRVRLGIAEGADAAQPVEVIRETDRDALNR